MLTLDGKIAVVTGALGGMGRAVCERFGAEGATVVGMDWTDEGSELFAKEMAQAGSKFEFRKVDVSSAVEVDEAAEVVAAQYGSIDVLYNNAGLMQLKPILETSNDEWDRILDVNLKSVFLMTRAFAPLMADRSGRSSTCPPRGGRSGHGTASLRTARPKPVSSSSARLQPSSLHRTSESTSSAQE